MPNSVPEPFTGWIIATGGAIVSLCGVLIGYIFSRHVRDDDRRHAENRADRDRCRVENREDHEKFDARLRKGKL